MRDNNELGQDIKHKIHKKEILFLIIIFVVIALIAIVFYGKNRDQGDKVIVKIDNEVRYEFLLNKEQEVIIKLDDQESNTLVVKDGKADIVDATCPDHLCVNMKSISLEGESIVCLPHKLIVEIQSVGNRSELDAMVQ